MVKKLIETFESDWTQTAARQGLTPPKDTDTAEAEPVVAPGQAVVSAGEAQKAVRILKKGLDPLAVSVKKAVRVAVAKVGDDVLGDKAVKETMKKIVKKAVKDAVREAVHDAQVAKIET